MHTDIGAWRNRNPTSQSGRMMDEPGFGGQESITYSKKLRSAEQFGGGIIIWGFVKIWTEFILMLKQILMVQHIVPV